MARSQSGGSTGLADAPRSGRGGNNHMEMEEAHMPRSIEVTVPTVPNASDYEYLPGHFSVRCILGMGPDQSGEASYEVKLESRERITVSLHSIFFFSESKLISSSHARSPMRYSWI